MPRKASPLKQRFQAIGYAAGVSPDEPDRSAFVQIEGLRIRSDALVRLRREHPAPSDAQLVASLVSGSKRPRPGKAK